MLRVGIYARVSTLDQQTLPMQIRALREYTAKRGWAVAMQVKEVGSGAAARQPSPATDGGCSPPRYRRGVGVAAGSMEPVRRRSRFHFA
jgi:hypothetical protein